MKNKCFRYLAVLMLLAVLVIPCMAVGASAAEPAVTVYVDAANGLDTNSGLTQAAAVKTIQQAYSILDTQMEAAGLSNSAAACGKILLVSDYVFQFDTGVTKQMIAAKAHTYEVIIAGQTAGIKFLPSASKSSQSYLGLQGPTTFENLAMYIDPDSSYTNVVVHGKGGLLRIGSGVTGPSNTALRLRLSAGPYAAYTGDMALEVNSGDWQDICAGGLVATMTGNGSLVMNGGSTQNLQVTYNGKHYGNCTITLNGGTVKDLYGGSRHANGIMSGNTTITLNGGTITGKVDTDGASGVSGTAALHLASANGLSLGYSGTITANSLSGGALTLGTSTRIRVTEEVSGVTAVKVNGTASFGTAYVTGPADAPAGAVLYSQGICQSSGGAYTMVQAQPLQLRLQYDDRKDLSALLGQIPETVTITDQVVTSYQVGTNQPDTHVISYANGKLYAVGTGTAVLTVNGTSHTVTVSPATLSLFMITGHSVGAGDGGSIGQSVLCEAGQVYSTHRFYGLPSAEGGLGYGAPVRAGVNDVSSQQHLDAFTADGVGTTGEGSALGYQWNQLTGEKVWVLNLAVGGSCLNEWQTGVKGHATWSEYHYDTAIRVFGYAQSIVKNEVAAGHYHFGHMAAFYHNGVNYSNYPGWTYEKIQADYAAMWGGYKEAFTTDMDGDGKEETITLGLLPFYNFSNEYNDLFDKPAAYYMAASAQYSDIYIASNIYFQWMKEEGLSSFPEITYTAHNGNVLRKPVSVAHSNNGGTSTDSVFCKADNMHPTQVVHNAVGMDIANNLYRMLFGSNQTDALTFMDQAHNALQTMELHVGESKLLVPMTQSGISGNVTFRVSGVLSMEYPLQISADRPGTGTVEAVVDGQVLAQVTVNVSENTHSHCRCGGQSVQYHSCDDTTVWTAWGDDPYEQTLLPFLSGHYYLVTDITVNRSMLIEPDETIFLCLNGHTVSTNGERTVNNQGTLVLTDCGEQESWGTLTSTYNGSYSQIFYNYADSVLEIYAGKFVPAGSSAWGGVGLNHGTLKIYNGLFYGATNVTKNSLESRGGTLYMIDGEIHLYGGTIYGGSASKGGSIYAERGTLVIDGATITGGQASLGGNIFGSFYTTITMASGVIEDGVSKNEGGNLYFYTSSTTDADNQTIPRNSQMTMTGGVIRNGTATAGSNLFITTGTNSTPGVWAVEMRGGQILGKAEDVCNIVLRNNAEFALSGGQVSGSAINIRLEKSKATAPAPVLILKDDVCLSDAPVDLYLDQTNNGSKPISVQVQNLTSREPISVDASSEGEFAVSDTDLSDCFTAVKSGYVVAYSDGALLLTKPLQVLCGTEVVGTYSTLAEAVTQAAGGYIRLLGDVQETFTLSGELIVDLNGHSLSGITVTGTLYGMDSATDDYTDSAYGVLTCSLAGDGKVVSHWQSATEQVGAVKRYLTVIREDSYSFHRFYLGITHATIQTATQGVGYKAVFCGSDTVKAQLTGFGYCLQLGDNRAVTAQASSFISRKTVSLRVDNYDVAGYGEIPLKVFVFMTFGQETVCSGTVSYSLRDMMESANRTYDSFSHSQKLALQAMAKAYADVMKNWQIGNFAPEE